MVTAGMCYQEHTTVQNTGDSSWLLHFRISLEVTALSNLCTESSIMVRGLTFHTRGIGKFNFHVAALCLGCRVIVLVSRFSASKLEWPRVAPGCSSFCPSAGSEGPNCCIMTALLKDSAAWCAAPPDPNKASLCPHLTQVRGVLSRLTRCCQMLSAALPEFTLQLSAITAPSLTYCQHGTATSHPFLGAASPVPVKAEVLCNTQ